MLLYEKLTEMDVIGPVRKLLDQRLLKIDPVTKKITATFGLDPERPWINNVMPSDRNCSYWMSVCFEYYRLVPKACYDCWKVVAKPETLEQLMKINQLQIDLGLPGKCGMEQRSWTSGIYNSFWYGKRSEGLKGGRWLYRLLRKRIDKEIDPSMKVILKRGCT